MLGIAGSPSLVMEGVTKLEISVKVVTWCNGQTIGFSGINNFEGIFVFSEIYLGVQCLRN